MAEYIKPVDRVKVPVKSLQDKLNEAITRVSGSLPEAPPSIANYSTVWRGIKFGDDPILGISMGRPTVGLRGIRFPKLEDWQLAGAEGAPFEPRTALETRVLVNRSALEQAGMASEQAAKFTQRIEATLDEVYEFYGKKSPTFNTELLTKSIDTFSDDGVRAILEWANKNKKYVDRIFGSTTLRAQLSKDALEEWIKTFGREPGDIDLLLKNVTPDQAKLLVQDLVRYITEHSPDKPWISADRGTLIENYSRSTGAKRHAIDVHYEGEPTPAGGVSPSKYADMVYGFQKLLPAVKVKVKGVGDITLSRLSETGVGKVEQVLGWRRDSNTGEVILKTEAHRIKDYADLYEIIKTYRGQKVADNWAYNTGISDILKEYAEKQTGAKRLFELKPQVDDIISELDNIINSTKDKLATGILPRLKKILNDINKLRDDNGWKSFTRESPKIPLKLQEWTDRLMGGETPKIGDIRAILQELKTIKDQMDDFIKRYQPTRVEWSWVYKPSEYGGGRTPAYTTPVVSVLSNSLVSALRSPVIGYASTGQVISIPSEIPPTLSRVMVSPTSSSESPSVIIDYSPSMLSEIPSPAPIPLSPATSLPPASPLPPSVISPSIPSTPPSPPPIGSTPPSPPSPPPSEPIPPPTETKKPKPILFSRGGTSTSNNIIPGGSIAWASGEILSGRGKSRVKRPVWKYIPPPYNMDKPITLLSAPRGAVNSESVNSYDTIQVIGRSRSGVPERVSVDLGWTDITVVRGQQIIHKSGGETTNVGTRLASNTRGMSIGEDVVVFGDEVEELPHRTINRVTMSKKKPRRKRLSDYEYMTTLKGFKP
jgi:hypothetical protein